MAEGKRVAIYARVSTDRQTNENQMLDLQRLCSTRGWTVVQTFVDDAVSGSTKNRTQLDRLMAFVREGRCDCVLVWRYDRFARSGSHLVNTLEEFRGCGVDFASYHEGIDTTTPQGKFFFMVVAGFAEFERSIIIDRINSGLRRARENGKRLGRPKLPDEKIAEVAALLGTGSLRAVAAQAGVSKSAVGKIWDALKGTPEQLSFNPPQNVA